MKPAHYTITSWRDLGQALCQVPEGEPAGKLTVRDIGAGLTRILLEADILPASTKKTEPDYIATDEDIPF